MQDSGGNHKANLLTKFKFLSNSFDGLEFDYDHLNATKDVEKVKTIGAQLPTLNIGAYLMRCAVMTRGLFEVGDAYEKYKIHLTKEITQLKDILKIDNNNMEDLNKKTSKMKKQKEAIESKCLELETTSVGLIQDV